MKSMFVDEEEMEKRIAWIDVAKGICMIAIVIGHLNNEWINRIVFSFHFPLLFMLSGYTLTAQKADTSYFSREFDRLMKPYFVCRLLICFCDVINCFFNRDYSIMSFTNIIFNHFQRLWITSEISVIWLLPAMFFGLLFAQMILQNAKGWKERFLIGGICALSANMMHYHFGLPFSILSGLFATVFILFGKWIKESDVLEKMNIKHYALCLCIFVMAVVMNQSKLYVETAFMTDYILTPICTIASSLLVLKGTMLLENNRFLQWIGKNSMLVLQIHILGMEASALWYGKVFGESGLLFAWILTIIVVVFVKELIEKYLMHQSNSVKDEVLPDQRDKTIDIYKGILIMLMLVGHAKIDKGLRNTIYSFHMFAFVLMSGYFYRSGGLLKDKIKKLINGILKPYAFFCVFYCIFGGGTLQDRLITSLMGMSFSKKLFVDIESIGPVYFLLMLFCTRLVFLFIDHFSKNEMQRFLGVGALSLAGYCLGLKGYWLPWSLDCALYCLAFYYIGLLLRKYNILNLLKSNRYMYFVLLSFWMFSLNYGAMELATRKYNDYGFFMIGSLAGILVIYLFCTYLSEKLPEKMQRVMLTIGQSTVYILIVHRLFSGTISRFSNSVLLLDRSNVPHLFFLCMMQIVFGVILGYIYKWMNSCMARTGKMSVRK